MAGAYPFSSGGLRREENPSGALYTLDKNGGNWEGKDLQLIEKGTQKPEQPREEKLKPVKADFIPFLNNFIQNQFQDAKEINNESIKETVITDLLSDLEEQNNAKLKPYIKYLSTIKKD